MPRIHNGKRIFSLTNGSGKLDRHIQNNDVGPLPYTVHKNKLKVGLKLKCETLNYKTYRRKNKGKASRHLSWQWLLGFHTKSTGQKKQK